jgi:flavoprotein
MKKTFFLLSFLSQQSAPTVLWCYTGAGHRFEENFEQIIKLNRESIPICFIFSDAGALVANRYGFFWKLSKTIIKKDLVHFLFQNEEILNSNIKIFLNQMNLSYDVIPFDPSFSIAISLAYNKVIACIIGSPLTANTVAKLANGLADNFTTNLIAHGIKAGINIGIFPTDAISSEETSILPIRYNGKGYSKQIETAVCQYNAIKEITLSKIDFLARFCVGCKKCVEKYPEFFTFGDQIKVKIRNTDIQNVKKLRSEVVVFSSPKRIENFVRKQMESD